MAEVEWDPRAVPDVDAEIGKIQNQINYQFDFEEVVGAVFALLERRTNLRGLCLAVLGADLKKRPLVSSPTLTKAAVARGYPILAYPLPLTNDELRYTLDVYSFKDLQLKSSDAPVIRECLRLLFQAVNKEYHERDPLTGVYNRQGLKRRFQRKLEEAKRDGAPLAVLMMDLDHFKKVNDTYGHPAGDLVLTAFARATEDVVTGKGVVGRYGGEEFLVLLPGADAEGGAAVAEQIRAKTEKLKIVVDEGAGKVIRPTCSVGVAFFPGHGDDPDTLVNFADLALYEAKNAGRNRVVVYPTDAPDVRIKKLGEVVRTGRVRTPLESCCRLFSLRQGGLVDGLPVAVAVVGAKLFILDGQSHLVRVYDGRAKKFVATFGGRGEDVRELEGPVDVVATAGAVWVVDAPAHAVKVFGVAGEFLRFLGGRDARGAPVPGFLKGAFNWPVAVTVDGAGRILVAEHINRRVQRFNAAGEFDGLEIPLHSVNEGLAFQPDPRDVAADGVGNIYVLDAANNVINKYSPEGAFVAAFGGPGAAGEPLQFKGLTSLEVDRLGKLAGRLAACGVGLPQDTKEVVVAAEAGDVNRLQFFDTAGVLLGQLDFSKMEGPAGTTVRPGRLAVSAGGRVYLVDQEQPDVVVVTIGDV